MILFKEGVILRRLTESLCWIFTCLLKVDGTEGFPENLVITSVNDGEHSKVPLSRHYTDEALDVRSHNFINEESKEEFITIMLAYLNKSPVVLVKDKFTILFENKGTSNEHFHIQVRKGETYP